MGFRKYFETNDDENITYQNQEDIAKAVIRGKLIALDTYMKERLKTNDKKLKKRTAKIDPKKLEQRKK